MLTVEYAEGSRRGRQGVDVKMLEPLDFGWVGIYSPRYGGNTREMISCVFATTGRMASRPCLF